MLIISIAFFALFYHSRILLDILTDCTTVSEWAFTACTVAVCVTAGMVLLCSLLSIFSGKRFNQAFCGAILLLAMSGLHTYLSIGLSVVKGWLLWSYISTGVMWVICLLFPLSNAVRRRKEIRKKEGAALKRKRHTSSSRRRK